MSQVFSGRILASMGDIETLTLKNPFPAKISVQLISIKVPPQALLIDGGRQRH